MVWKPHVTVAAVVERDGAFLMVEEFCNGRVVINQPAGHLDEGESLLSAVQRETLEETAWRVRPTALTGIYQWQSPRNQKTYLRFCFAAEYLGHDPQRSLDEGILQAMWLTRDELVARVDSLRSPMVMQCIEDYLAGLRYPLNLLSAIAPD